MILLMGTIRHVIPLVVRVGSDACTMWFLLESFRISVFASYPKLTSHAETRHHVVTIIIL